MISLLKPKFNSFAIGILTLTGIFSASQDSQAQASLIKAHYGIELATTNNVLSFDVRTGPSINLKTGDISGDIKQFYSYRFARIKEIFDFHLRAEAGGSYNFKEKDMVYNIGADLRATYKHNAKNHFYISIGIDKNEFTGSNQFRLKALDDFAMIRAGVTHKLTDDKNLDQFLNLEGQQYFMK